MYPSSLLGSIDPNSELGYVPAPRHAGRYRDAVLPRRGNHVANLGELDQQPAIRHALANLVAGADTGDLSLLKLPRTDERTVQRRAEMLLAVDESLGRIMAALEARGVLDRTAIVLTSDNGFFYDEHGLTSERRLPYEESIRNPLLVRYPPLVPAGARPRGLVLTTDLAPTVLDLASAPIAATIQGRSLLPLLRGDARDWRHALLVEFYTYENPFPHLMDMDYRAVRTDRYKYIHWMRFPDQAELYDLQTDSLERSNLVNDPRYAGTLAEMRAELQRQVLQAMGLSERGLQPANSVTQSLSNASSSAARRSANPSLRMQP